MMAPLARVVHSLPGRKRIKIDERRGDTAYFETLQKELADCPGVGAVVTNSRTGTALVIHKVEDPVLWRYIAEHGLLQLGKNETSAPAVGPSIVDDIRNVERKPYPKSGKKPDIRRLIFLGMMGMGVVQVIRGNIAIPAIAAFWYAYFILPATNDDNPEHSFLETKLSEES
ncbi:HMA2 domain-containing protein [Nitrosospira multiformis]|uniref:HMA2 domain-containing protein n=1 Tax=Nitrosospira multiformis TaxID=1231 RepID=UPI00115F9D4D|nr:hypothetical protein [Nitrosospira multiformis]